MYHTTCVGANLGPKETELGVDSRGKVGLTLFCMLIVLHCGALARWCKGATARYRYSPVPQKLSNDKHLREITHESYTTIDR